MGEQISKMDEQLRDTSEFSLVIAVEKNKAKRNVCLFFGVVVLGLVYLLSWNKWLLLIPALFGIGTFLYHMNIVIVASEMRRRRKEADGAGVPE